jgi:hypothetical protein
MNLIRIGGFRIGIVGMLTLILGMFTPVLYATGFGSVPLWRYDLFVASFVLFSAGGAFLLLALGYAKPALFLAVLNAFFLGLGLLWILGGLPLLRDRIEARYRELGFGGYAHTLLSSIRPEWGWLVLFAASTLLITGAIVSIVGESRSA